MMITRLTIFTVVFAIFSSLVIADGPCRFQDPVRGTIDLSSIGRTDGHPVYKDRIPSGSNYKYSYNPCKPFSEENDCTNVAACQVSLDRKYSFAIGTQETASWNPVPMPGSPPTITYTSGAKRAIVSLVCSTDGREGFEALGESAQNTYKFRLIHRCACWNGCGDTTTQTTAVTITTTPTSTTSSVVPNSCRFQDPVRGTIDLSSVGRTDGQPAYKDKLPAGSNYKYSYNPCKPFSEGTDCTNVAGCQVSLDGLYAFAIGRQETASWNPVPMPGASPTITYTNGEKRTIVSLVCSLEGRDEFEALGEDPQNTYKLRLTHRCACWNGCDNTTPQTTTVTTTQTTAVTTTATPTTSSVVPDPCRFQDPVRGTIDLSSVGRTDGQPAYKDKLPSGSNYKYSYNPCKPFSEGTDCTNVAGCQVSLDGLYAFAIGRQETASWNPVPMPGASPTITYTSGEKKSIVTLVCSLEGRDEFEALGEDPQNTYKLRLTHRCACWNGCGNTTPQTTTVTTVTTTQTTAVTTTQTTTLTSTTSSVVPDSCRFQDPVRGTIDLSSIGRTDGQPAYKDTLPAGSNYKYSYNPCKPFSEGTDCTNVAGCQVSLDGLYAFAIGRQETASWNPVPMPGASPTITYTNGEKKTIVSLICSTEGRNEFQALGEDPQNTYKFRLTHRCACWDGCGNTTPPTSTKSGGCSGITVSGGTVFIILPLVLSFLFY